MLREHDAHPCVTSEVIASLAGESNDEGILANAEHIAKSITLDAVNGKYWFYCSEVHTSHWHLPLVAGTDTVCILHPMNTGRPSSVCLQTTSVLQIVFFAMSLYPSIQDKVHTELDAIVGPDRLPDFSDRASLVYLNAVIKEAMRWMPPAPLGLTHCTREDDVINGYFIPARTVLLGNIWYIDSLTSACMGGH